MTYIVVIGDLNYFLASCDFCRLLMAFANNLNQGQIQDFLKGCQTLGRGFDLLTLPDYLLFFLIFLKFTMKMKSFCLKWGYKGCYTHDHFL